MTATVAPVDRVPSVLGATMTPAGLLEPGDRFLAGGNWRHRYGCASAWRTVAEVRRSSPSRESDGWAARLWIVCTDGTEWLTAPGTLRHVDPGTAYRRHLVSELAPDGTAEFTVPGDGAA